MVKLDKNFKKKFPHLSKEIGGEGTVKIDAVRSSADAEENSTISLEGYNPTVIDFIRRCETDQQALEIIDFMENKGEIKSQYAKKLRDQLVKMGLRSFGKKKEAGSYERGEI